MTKEKMMTTNRRDEIIEIVFASIAKIKEIPPATISLDSTFEDLKIHSLDGLDLFFELEEAFDLTIPDSRAQSLRAIRDIVEELEKMLSERSSGSPIQS